ncbi:SDR family NAD(P)-dependent oxidoreductase [Arthrobacter sp. NEB 688]|uniref:SDR family NAD(P)-dependent oxidoreductase n=1 Tax=Arthrobacter sp. NEB 688 TaxID=904039 RepID=UPI001564ACC7|nr:SDR family NAD(P)-dependent oxidoreductase [Arthrobacter sp. NEB 688]QKE84501.1 SDR family NAD(P)-dependent oxidoreductase [Arthrobacter sp. NEB 688]
MPRYSLDGRVVAITGSTGGLGREVASALRARGARLAVLDLDQDAVDTQALALGGPDVARGWRVDVRDMATLEDALAGAAEHFGGIDVVVANAGIECMSAMSTLSLETFERIVDINLTGVWRTFKAALPHVSERRGYLMAVSSMAAFVHSPLQGGYTASKAGVWALCDSTRLEVRHLGVDVGSVHPTFFQTPMMDNVFADPAGLRLWGGNKKGLWKMVSRDSVIEDIVSGIEHRRKMVVCPKRNTFLARIPGLVHPVIDRIGFPGRTVPDAIALTTRG